MSANDFCTTCGSRLTGTPFCVSCGSPVAGPPAPPAADGPSSTRRNVLLTVGAAAVVVVLAAAAFFVFDRETPGAPSAVGTSVAGASSETGPPVEVPVERTADPPAGAPATASSVPATTLPTSTSDTPTTSSSPEPVLPTWCVGVSGTDPLFPDVLNADNAWTATVTALEAIARLEDATAGVEDILARVEAAAPIGTTAEEVLVAAYQDDPTALDEEWGAADRQVERSCGAPAFDPVRLERLSHLATGVTRGLIIDASPSSACDYPEGIGTLDNLRIAFTCDDTTVLTRNLLNDSEPITVFEAKLPENARVQTGATTIGWVDEVTTPASGLNPPIWTITVPVLSVDTGQVTTFQIATPDVNGKPAQSGDVDLTYLGADNLMISVSGSGGGVVRTMVRADKGEAVKSFVDPSEYPYLSPLDGATRAVQGVVLVDQQAVNANKPWVDYANLNELDVPGGGGDQTVVRDAGCNVRAGVFTSGDGGTYGPNTLISAPSGKVVVTALPTIENYPSSDPLTGAGWFEIVSAEDAGTAEEVLAMRSYGDGAIAWTLGTDVIQPDRTQAVLGVLLVVNNSDEIVLVDPTTGKEAEGLSVAAREAVLSTQPDHWVSVETEFGTAWISNPLDPFSERTYVLTAKDGICS